MFFMEDQARDSSGPMTLGWDVPLRLRMRQAITRAGRIFQAQDDAAAVACRKTVARPLPVELPSDMV